jgi:hypothetical protein
MVVEYGARSSETGLHRSATSLMKRAPPPAALMKHPALRTDRGFVIWQLQVHYPSVILCLLMHSSHTSITHRSLDLNPDCAFTEPEFFAELSRQHLCSFGQPLRLVQ